MARYTGPKARINRRLGGLIYESSGASRAYERRQQPPGMHTRGKRPSNYGQALYEKHSLQHVCASVFLVGLVAELCPLRWDLSLRASLVNL